MPTIERHEEFDNSKALNLLPSGIDPISLASETDKIQTVKRAINAEALAHKQAIVLEIIETLLAPSDLQGTLDTFVVSLKEHGKGTRVVLALASDAGLLELAATSQTSSSRHVSQDETAILQVMNESLKYERLVLFRGLESDIDLRDEHPLPVKLSEQVSVAVVPCYKGNDAVGVLLFEKQKDEIFTPALIELLEHVAMVCAPTLALRIDAERGVVESACRQLTSSLKSHFGSVYSGIRILLVAIVGFSVLTTFVPFSRDVVAKAELVPQQRRLVTAPFDGFIDELLVRPGDSVEAGQLLVQLEQLELEQEGARRDGDVASAEAEFRYAMASHNRQATAIARARLDREQALRALVDQRLDRVELRAPITGLVISGDRADAVGAPVRRGETLFEIAQADTYDVHILVHERDVRDIYIGQSGTLALTARPAQDLPLQVHTIHPVAESIEGVSHYRVSANLNSPEGVTTHPGESGVAKLNAGKSNFWELWGRPMAQRLTELWWRLTT
ncbi:MAG: HlyD family efflux transporter periplasmic adaptor subunit [Granulosicoccus sp.]